MALLWLPRRLYVSASSPLEVRQNLPPSHRQVPKSIILLPPEEGTSLTTFKARKALPTRSWVRIKKSALYKGDLGYVETSDGDNAVVVVAPRQRPYDIPEQSGEKMEFDVELARLADLPLEPILSPAGTEIGYTCSGQQFVCGLLRLSLPVHTLELVELPHPDDIKYHAMANCALVEETVHLFSAQFWREKDRVEIQEGDLKGKLGTLRDIHWDQRTAIVSCDEGAFDCSLRELRRHFELGDAVRVIAGPFSGEAGYVVSVRDNSIVLSLMQEDGNSETVSSSHSIHPCPNKIHRLKFPNYSYRATCKIMY